MTDWLSYEIFVLVTAFIGLIKHAPSSSWRATEPTALLSKFFLHKIMQLHWNSMWSHRWQVNYGAFCKLEGGIDCQSHCTDSLQLLHSTWWKLYWLLQPVVSLHEKFYKIIQFYCFSPISPSLRCAWWSLVIVCLVCVLNLVVLFNWVLCSFCMRRDVLTPM